ncbi:MAG: hypothetical protein ACXACA_07870, partial [Candidatus Ranarchaeia archaeon]
IDSIVEGEQEVFKRQADAAKALESFQRENDPSKKAQKLVMLKAKEVALADAQARAATEATGEKREELAAAKEKEKMQRELQKRKRMGKAAGINPQTAV